MAKEKNEEKNVGGVTAPATESMPQSQRDKYRQRVNADQYGDDEEGYYEAANKRLDELDALNNGVNNLRSVMDNNPYFAQWIVEAKKNKDFNPILYGIENGYLDIDALRDDPEYSQKLADAQNKWLESKAKSEESDKVLASNLGTEIEGCIEDGMAQGMTREEALEQVGKTLEYLDKLDRGEIRELNAILLKGMNHDADVEAAQMQGEANGRATKVKDALRSMPTQTARSGGSQPRGAESMPNDSRNSMFGL